MSTSPTQSSAHPAVQERPWSAVLRAARRSLVICLVAGFSYSFLTTGSRGGSTGPVAPGQPEYEVNLTLQPSPLVFLAIAVIYFTALHRALTRASDEAIAVRAFRRASLVVGIVATCSVLIADIWFFASPLGGWPEPNTWLAPFPFGGLHVETKIISGM